MKLDDALEEYRFAVLDLSANTQRWYEHKLRLFGDWCGGQKKNGNMLLEEINPSLIRKYLDDYRTTSTQQYKRPPTGHTIRGSAQVIRGFLRWCTKEGLLTTGDVAARIKMPKVDQKVIETFTQEQIKRMFLACKRETFLDLQYRDRGMLAVFLGTGLRAAELCGLKLSDISIDPRNPKGSYIRVFGKGRKEREVGLPPSAIEHMMKYIRHHRPQSDHPNVFLSRNGQPLTPSGLFQWMERLGDWASIVGVRCSPHTLRHTFAISFLLAGGDVYILSRILGHSTVSTTEIYLRAMKQNQVRRTSFSALDNL